MRTRVGMVVVALVFGGSALAQEDPWGKPEGAAKCAQELDRKSPHWINGPYMQYENGKPYLLTITPECKAEVDKRVELCLKDSAYAKSSTSHIERLQQKGLTTEQAMAMECADESFQRVKRQAERALKEKAERDAALAEAAKTELPKSEKKNPGVEKQIAAAYKEAYPENKVLMVIMQSKDWSTERNNFGVITNRNIQAIVVNKQKDGTCQLHNEAWTQEYKGGKFAGKLEQRGAGSQRLSYILCEKVPGGKK